MYRLKKVSSTGIWHAVYWSPGLRERQVSMRTRVERVARRLAGELLATPGMIWAETGEDQGAWRLSVLWARYERLTPDRGLRGRQGDRQAWGRLTGELGDVRAREVSAARLEEWAASYRRDGMAAATARAHKATCARIWKIATRLPCPFAGMAMRRDRVNGARRPFSPQLLRDLLQLFRREEPELYPLALLLAETGLRLGDGARLAWSSVDLPGAVISLRMSKTGEVVEIPLHGELLALLAKLPRGGGCVWPAVADLYETRPRDLSRRLKRLLRKLGCEPRVDLPGRARPLSVYNWHSFRHSFVKRLAGAKVANSVIMAMTGHKSPELVLHYSQEVSLEEKRGALEAGKLPKLPDFRRDLTGPSCD